MASADFTIADVLAWARTKPAGERYDYLDGGNCALCQFLRETGRCAEALVGPWGYGDAAGYHKLPEGANDAVQATCKFPDRLTGDDRWTFGKLVARLETLCPEIIVAPSEWTKLDAYLTERVDA